MVNENAEPFLGPRVVGWTCHGCPALEQERWREPSGDGETWDSGTCNRCRAMDRRLIDGAYGATKPASPVWCPHWSLWTHAVPLFPSLASEAESVATKTTRQKP